MSLLNLFYPNDVWDTTVSSNPQISLLDCHRFEYYHAPQDCLYSPIHHFWEILGHWVRWRSNISNSSELIQDGKEWTDRPILQYHRIGNNKDWSVNVIKVDAHLAYFSSDSIRKKRMTPFQGNVMFLFFNFCSYNNWGCKVVWISKFSLRKQAYLSEKEQRSESLLKHDGWFLLNPIIFLKQQSLVSSRPDLTLRWFA